jgi:hypothetical protein
MGIEREPSISPFTMGEGVGVGVGVGVVMSWSHLGLIMVTAGSPRGSPGRVPQCLEASALR